MKARPILFNAAMVNALLDGRKTQTRRILKTQPVKNGYFWEFGGAAWSDNIDQIHPVPGHSLYYACPYGKLGDLLWVRETFRLSTMDDCACYEPCGCIFGVPIYLAQTGQQCDEKWKPSIFMPRWASRLTLRIKSVRLERLNDISEQDAIAEGCDNSKSKEAVYVGWFEKPVKAFRRLWESINGFDSWKTNPWVWVIEFEVIQKNVDEVIGK